MINTNTTPPARLLSKDDKRKLLGRILSATGFVQGTHTGVDLGFEYNYDEPVYIGISPRAELTGRHGAHRISQVLDLRDFPKGVLPQDSCNRNGHVLTEFYWETGGGSLDSGSPHRYVCCTVCGVRSQKPGFLGRLLGKPLPLVARQSSLPVVYGLPYRSLSSKLMKV